MNTWFICPFALSLHVVGNPCCLALLCPIRARRDKLRPQFRERNCRDTNDLRSPCKYPHSIGTYLTISEYKKFSRYSDSSKRYSRNTKSEGLQNVKSPFRPQVPQFCFNRLETSHAGSFILEKFVPQVSAPHVYSPFHGDMKRPPKTVKIVLGACALNNALRSMGNDSKIHPATL